MSMVTLRSTWTSRQFGLISFDGVALIGPSDPGLLPSHFPLLRARSGYGVDASRTFNALKILNSLTPRAFTQVTRQTGLLNAFDKCLMSACTANELWRC